MLQHNLYMARTRVPAPNLFTPRITGAQSRDQGSYSESITVYHYDGQITDTNLHVRPSEHIRKRPVILCVKSYNLNLSA